MKRLSLFIFLMLCGCQVDSSTCTDGRVNGRETDLDCGGAQCAGCADGKVCLTDSDCANAVCTLNRCAAPSCVDGVKNGLELEVDCGGACAPCVAIASCTDAQRNGLETGVDCGGSCAPCPVGQGCVRNSDCASAVCSDGLCGGALCAPLLSCGNACVDSRFDPLNCGGCGVTCGASLACVLGQCLPACGGGTRLCGGACVDPSSDPSNCGGCGTPCGGAEICVGGMCFLPCAPGQVACGQTCASLDRDAQHCGMCGRACPLGSACVSGQCTAGCQAPLSVCASGQCVDPRNDPDNCGGCAQPCPAGGNALRACSTNVCVTGPCLPGFADCNGQAPDGCEAELGIDSANCGRCNQPCGGTETCQLGRCCGTLPSGSYQTTCVGCEACGPTLSCLCEDALQVLMPTTVPLGCPVDYSNCNGVLTCGSC